MSDTDANFRIGLTEPYLFGRALAGTVDLFRAESTANSRSFDSTGINIGTKFSAAKDVSHQVIYSLSESESKSTSTSASSISGESGITLLKSMMTYRLGQDTRDIRRDPSEGHFSEITESFAGIGGDVSFLRTEVAGGYYKPLLFKAVVLGVRAKAGHISGIGENVTQSNRLFLGGKSVRGFAGNGIGPRDTGSKSAVGGNNSYSGTLEVVSNLGVGKDIGLRWTVFSDFGSVWNTDYPSGVTGADDATMRRSIGFGVLWDTAVGPLSFYWASPVSKMSHDETKTFQFSIGTRL